MIIYDVIVNFRTQLPEIVEIEVVEKPKTFVRTTSDHISAYGYVNRIAKDKAWLTAEDALEGYIEMKARRVERLEQNLSQAKVELERYQKLRQQI